MTQCSSRCAQLPLHTRKQHQAPPAARTDPEPEPAAQCRAVSARARPFYRHYITLIAQRTKKDKDPRPMSCSDLAQTKTWEGMLLHITSLEGCQKSGQRRPMV